MIQTNHNLSIILKESDSMVRIKLHNKRCYIFVQRGPRAHLARGLDNYPFCPRINALPETKEDQKRRRRRIAIMWFIMIVLYWLLVKCCHLYLPS